MHHNTRGRPSPVTGLPHGRHPATSPEMVYEAEEVEFLMAVERYKRERHRPCLTWIEVLDIARALGWRKVEEPFDLPKFTPRP